MDIWTRLGRYAFLKTKRMYLRPFAHKDSQDFFKIRSNPDNLRLIFPSRASHHESDYLMAHYFTKEPFGVWAIEDKKSHKIIGCIRFEEVDLNRSFVEIGHFLNQQFWGQGLMTESLKTLRFSSFQEFSFRELHVIAHEESLVSQHVTQELGFKSKQRFKRSDRYTRKMRDYINYQTSKGGYRHE